MGQKTGGFDSGKKETILSHPEVKVWSGQPAGPRWQPLGVNRMETLDKEEETELG